MEKKYYTVERNVQIVISLLKAHGIRKVIASPGTTNMTFVGSIQNDPFFEIYSSVDDGGQDESNVAITINGGTFEGTSGSAVINTKATQNQFALMIYGGKFSSNPSTYVSTSYTITEDNGWFVVTK